MHVTPKIFYEAPKNLVLTRSEIYYDVLIIEIDRLILPLSCLKSYCSVLSLSLIINESEAEKSATVPEYSSPSKKEKQSIRY